MTVARWRQVESLCHAALARPADERAAFLAEACRDDVSLRTEVESLIARAESSPSFLEAPVIGTSTVSLAGRQLGAYRIESSIGAGGMGEVYRAKDTRLGRAVALKILPAAWAADEQRRSRFEREARAVAALNHPNICTIHDVGRDQGIDYLVMELVDGVSLAGRLAKGPLPLDDALAHAIEIADALDRAHGQGIIHRDLKPGNVMLAKTGSGKSRATQAKLLDFGLARIVPAAVGAGLSVPTDTSPMTEAGVLLGTLQYMAPEQIEGRPADARTDVFAFGALLHEMVTGRRAFDGASTAALMAAILREEPPPIHPREVDRIVRRCLAKDPLRRYQSARDLLNDLEEVRQSVDAGRLEQSGRRRLRTLRSVRFVAAAVLFAAVSGLAFFLGSTRAPTGQPSFRRLTFHRGTVMSARFSPDGQTIVYGAAWDGEPVRVFTTRTDGTASSQLDLPDADVLAVSSRSELALSLNRRLAPLPVSRGTLARVAMGGGAPRELAENVIAADWSPDGKELAIIRRDVQGVRLEFPIGTVLHRGDCVWPRVSPDGELVAFVTGQGSSPSELWVVDRRGNERRLAAGGRWYTLAWAPSGDEVYFTSDDRGTQALHAVTLSGRRRLVARFPEATWLLDINRDGSMLIATQVNRREIMVSPPGTTGERNIAWLGGSLARAISSDGTQLLSAENTSEDAFTWTMYLRRVDVPSPAKHLGDGFPLDLSPDGRWVLSTDPNRFIDLSVVPTGAGETHRIPLDMQIEDARWFPDSRTVLLVAAEKGRPERTFVLDTANPSPRPLTAEGILGTAISPDGRSVVAQDDSGKLLVYAASGGEPRAVPGVPERGEILAWSTDGRSLYVADEERTHARVFKRDVETGRREFWKEIRPADTIGLMDRIRPVLTRDGRAYAYTCQRWHGTLYLVQGLK